jgi:uncharacterized protein (TIGR03067 family)
MISASHHPAYLSMTGATMKTATALLACALCGALGQLGAQDKAAKLNPAKLVGKWEFVSGIKNGTKVTEESLKKHVMTITKDTITLKAEDTFVMKYDLDTSQKPAGIKLEMLESPFGAGAKSEGVIEVSGDQLRLCYAPMGEDAPKTFDAKEGSKMHLFVLKRAK